MFRNLKWAQVPTEGRELTPGQVAAACLYGLAFALFVLWRRFAG